MVLEKDISFKAHKKLVNVVRNMLLKGQLKCYYEQKSTAFFSSDFGSVFA